LAAINSSLSWLHIKARIYDRLYKPLIIGLTVCFIDTTSITCR